MRKFATALSAVLVFCSSGSACSAKPPLAEFMPSGGGAFQIDAEDVISVDTGEALGTTDRKTLSILVESAQADRWHELTQLNIMGTVTVKICGRVVSKDVLILNEMRGPIFLLISPKDVDWATAALLGKTDCELTN